MSTAVRMGRAERVALYLQQRYGPGERPPQGRSEDDLTARQRRRLRKKNGRGVQP
jgi:hypothetical protein